ncbi:MAG: hypothetical protein HYY24_11990 [Verrucomicrobia bacterium]|nr:hypothetical protein [Verrucomicrobiota bacterium]
MTLWRWRRRGWVRVVNISGKCYVDLNSLTEFDRRAAAGEFARKPAGAARKSAEARAAQQVIVASNGGEKDGGVAQ